MTITAIITNNSGADKVYAGQTILNGESYTMTAGDFDTFREDSDLMQDIANGDVVVNDGSVDLDPIAGWGFILGNKVQAEITQVSSGTDRKIATHTSTKPIVDGKTYYATWAGAGDDMATGEAGAGPLAVVEIATANTDGMQDAHFHPDNGEVHLFDGYIQWEGAGVGDEICVEVRAAPSPVIDHTVSLDLVVDGDGWVSYSQSGPGTGTHGFAGVPSLIVRSFSKDGEWDYSSATGLVPNFAGTGHYKISTQDKLVHRFVNRLPMIASSYGIFSIDSTEATLVPQGLYVRMHAHTGDNPTGNLKVSCMMMLWREVTGQP